MGYVATSPQLAYYRTPGKWSTVYAAIYKPPIVYRARINQTFTTLDQVLSLTYDTGSGTLADVLPDMELWIGSSSDTYDKGIVRLRDRDATKFYISEVSEVNFADNDFLTVVAHFPPWARPVRVLTNGTVYMDETLYSDQHTNWDPMPNMGPNKVAELTGSSVNVGFDGSTSFCVDSSISSYAWTCSTASASSGASTSTVTFQFNSTGWHLVYLTVTAANGKSFWGVRFVYIWNETHPPSPAIINSANQQAESGGWTFEISMFTQASLTDFYDRAMVVVFSKDHYGSSQVNIGPVSGAENVKLIGWIDGETHQIISEAGKVTFSAATAHKFMGRIPSWPDGVQYVSGTPALWTRVKDLTVDKGTYHFLRWRSTITRIMDVTLTGDTRLTQEVSSSSQNLWGQLQELTWAQIYARPGVNSLNQLSIQIHPCLIPYASRTFPTVMALTDDDYQDDFEIERSVVDEVSIVDMSGVIVTAPNTGVAKFALAPGHSLPHYGEWDLQTNLLLSSQSQVITLAGLYRSWRNNPFKSIPLKLVAPIALIDCFPNQRCTISIPSSSNLRGFSYSGGVIPTSVGMVHDPDTGYLYWEVDFEAETVESQARQGDTPGSGGTDNPPSPTFPPLPDLPVFVPGLPSLSSGGPAQVLLHDASYGLLYTSNFNDSSPVWALVNGGLTGYKITQATHMFVTPSGAVYVACLSKMGNSQRGINYQFAPWIARAPSVGQPFVIIADEYTLWSDYPATTNTHAITGIGYNPLLPDTVAMIEGESTGLDTTNCHFWISTGGAAFVRGVAIPRVDLSHASSRITYGQATWMYISNRAELGTNGAYWRISADGSALQVASSGIWDISENEHFRASTTGILWVISGANRIRKSTDNGGTWTTISPGIVNQGAVDDAGQYMMSAYNNKSRSGDGGYSWSGIPNLPAGGAYYFAFAGGTGTSTRWIAARGIIRLSNDWGETWLNREGNVSASAPLGLNINLIHVVGL
jgi:hypothetical protein